MEISGERKRKVRKMATGRRWQSRLITCEITIAAIALLVVTFAGCTYFQELPEIQPDRFAPAAPDRSWIEAPGLRKEYALPPAPQSRAARVTVVTQQAAHD